MKLSVIIPVFNEDRSLKILIKEVKSQLRKSGIKYEIIVVEDGSTDKSLAVLEKIKGIQLIKHPINMGYGASLKTGIKASTKDWIFIIDADSTYSPSEIPKLIKAAMKEDVDHVIGSRSIKGNAIPANRKPAKIFLNLFSSYLAGQKIPDLNSGMRIFKKEIFLKYQNLFPDKFSFTSTLTMTSLSHSYNTTFVPIVYDERVGKSSISAMDFPKFIQLIVKLSLFFKPLKVFATLSFVILTVALIFPLLYVFGVTERFFDTSFTILISTALQTLFFGMLAEVFLYSSK